MRAMSIDRRVAVWACAMLLSVGGVAQAQVSTFSLAGTVADSSGSLLPGARVTIRNDKTGLTREHTTDSAGRYNLVALPVVGEYSVTVQMQGFASSVRKGLVFQANSKPVIDFTLQVGGTEAVTVTAEAPLLETRKAEQSLTVDQQKIETMPLNGRNYLDLALFSTGVNPTPGRGDLSINGQLGRNIDYMVDGVSNKVIEWGDASKGGLSVDTIQEFQIVSSQLSAEFGHSLSGVVSAVTKSGTNDFHGTVYTYKRLSDLDADNPLTGTKAPFDQLQFGATLSGPIVHNRTHFIASYEGTNQDSQLVVTSTLKPGAFPATLDRHLAFAKLTDNLSHNNTVQLRFNYDKRSSVGGFGGLVLPDGGTVSNRNNWDVQGTLTTLAGARAVNELRFQTSHFVNESTNITNAPRSVYTGLATFGGNPGSPQDIRENRLQLVEKLSLDLGAHRGSIGFDVSRIDKTGVFNADSIGVYTFAAGTPYPYNAADPRTYPVQFSQGFSDPRRPLSLTRTFPPFDFAGIDRNYWNLAFYAQDDWEVSRRLTVNLGVRYESQTSSPDKNNIMPRLGFAYNASGDGKLVVRGGYGRFYDQLFDNIPNVEDLFGVIGNFSVTLTPQGNPGLFPSYPNILPGIPSGGGPAPGRTATLDLRQYAPELRTTPYSDQLTLGVARELARNLGLSVDYVFLRGRDLFRTVDLNAPTAFDTSGGATRTVAQADATRPYGFPSRVPGPFGLQEGGFKQLRAVLSEGNSWYHAVKINLNKRYANGHSWQIAYTWSLSDNEQDDFGSAAQGADPFDFIRARAAADVPHALVANASVNIGAGFSIAGIFAGRSGRTVDPQAGADLNGDGFFTDRPGLLERNAFRMPGFYNLDLSLSKRVRFGAQHQAELRFDVFNVLDHKNVTGANATYGRNPAQPAATFLVPTAVANPRQFQAAIRYRF